MANDPEIMLDETAMIENTLREAAETLKAHQQALENILEWMQLAERKLVELDALVKSK